MVHKSVLFCVLTSVLFANHASANGAPNMRSTGLETRVRDGDTAWLSCVVQRGRGRPPTWRKAGSSEEDQRRHEDQLLAAGATKITSDDRISVMKDGGHEEPLDPDSTDIWVLSIRKVRSSDSGVYICELNGESILRSFHPLTVVPRDSALRNASVFELTSSAMKEQLPLRTSHTFACCLANNVSQECFRFCNIKSMLDGSISLDAQKCKKQFPTIRRCMTDGRNHVPCCARESIPSICQDACKGDVSIPSDLIRSHFSCALYAEKTLSCISSGIEILPSPPQDIDVESLSEKSLKVSWSPPVFNAATVTEYMVNVSILSDFDGSRFKPIENLLEVPEASSNFRITVPANKTSLVLNDLTVFTMYEITVTAINAQGTSLPSISIRYILLRLALTPSLGILTPLNVADPPRLPDTRQCCMNKGITSKACLDIFCDARNAKIAMEADLFPCAGKARIAFSCLANGHDHTACCRSRGLPDVCIELCRGNDIPDLDYGHLQCLQYMSDYSSCLLQGYGVLPGPPTKFRLPAMGADYAVMDWQVPSALGDTVQSYYLFHRKLDPETNEYVVVEKIRPPYILTTLQSDTLYEVYVKALNAHGAGQPSSRIVFKTKREVNEEEVQQSASSYNVSTCCASVALSEVCMPLCSYEAKFSDLTSLAGMCGQEFHKILRCGVGGRNHGNCCNRRGVPDSCLALCTGIIEDSPQNITKNCQPFIGNIIQCFEEGNGLLPLPVDELYATVTGNASVRLKWTLPAAADEGTDVTRCVLHYSKVLNDSVRENQLELENQINVTGNAVEVALEESSLYKLFVTAHNEHGSSLPSSIIIINTTNLALGSEVLSTPSPPHSLAVSGHSATWVTVDWQPPVFTNPNQLISYKFYYRPANETIFLTKTTTVTSHTLEGLGPNKQYMVYVTAHTTQGSSLPSETLAVWTDPAYPAFVEPPTVHPVNLITEGSSMTILCIAMGIPMPAISLYISGRLIRQEITRHMVTKIDNVTREMNQISCYADNGYGTPMQTSKIITISHVPVIQPSSTRMAVLGGSVLLECNVTATPQPQMVFLKDPLGRVPVIEGPKYIINFIPSNEEKNTFSMQLLINQISEQDEGDYFCHAENAFGSAVKPVSVRIHNTAASHNVTQCCLEQNVSLACMDACSFYLDIDAVIDKPQCISDFDKLMKCAADGSDHRSCCAAWGVPRRCLDWCRGEPLLSARLCVLSHTKQITGCFHEGRDRLPGPPRNVRVVDIERGSATIRWDKPMKNPHTVEIYRVFWRPIGVRTPEKMDTHETSVHIVSMKEGVTYECVLKAGNHFGTSALTEPVQFKIESKQTVPATQVSNTMSRKSLLIGVIIFCIASALIFTLMVWLIRNRKIFGIKTLTGVAFENPSYFKELNPETTQNMTLGAETASALKNLPSVSDGTILRLESLHPQSEVNPSLLEEFKLGHEGAGFKRLKLVSKQETKIVNGEKQSAFDDRKNTY